MKLRTRAIVVRSAVWMLGLVGLVFVPGTLAKLKSSVHAQPHGYGGAWPLPLGLIVFLVASLAWIGFALTLEIGISTLPEVHPTLAIFLDSSARVLPSLIALGLLFRRPSHAGGEALQHLADQEQQDDRCGFLASTDDHGTDGGDGHQGFDREWRPGHGAGHGAPTDRH